MREELEKTLNVDELRTLTQTLVINRQAIPEGAPDHRPKVRYIATDGASVIKIMGAAVYALQQKGLSENAEQLRKRILGGDYQTPFDALALIGDYVRLKIVDEEGKEIGDIG